MLKTAAGLLVLTGFASAATIFSDDFNTGVFINFNETPPGWMMTNGTVDHFAHGSFSLPCIGATGGCVDLDGTVQNAGRMESNALFTLQAGFTYTLTYNLAGSQRGDTNTVDVSLGTVTLTHTFPSSQGYTPLSLVFSPLVNSTGRIIFDHAGGDNFGLLLDNVALDETRIVSGAVPEPGTVGLLAIGFAAICLAARRRARCY